MLPRALIGDIKPENFLGLIDAIYAIILTLLLIELPGFFLDSLKEAELHLADHYVLLQAIAYPLFGYLAIFVIVYDVWAHHRVLIVYTHASRFNLAVGTFMLFLSSFLPSVITIIGKIKDEVALGAIHPSGLYSTILWDARLLLTSILIGIYGSIALISIKDLRAIRREEGSSSKAIILERLKYSSLVMLPIIILMAFLTFKRILHPPLPLMLIALSTYLPVDRLIVKLHRQLLPRRV
jgi:uncharacterized membrane protein